MKTFPQKTERIHSLDSLRAVMMLLGLVLHSAITYGTANYGNSWTIKDFNATHFSNDLIVLLIHSFRMPVFFLVAGFFGAMLFYERGPLNMVKNRISRIVFPFVVFLILLWPLIVFTFGYTGLIFAGNTNAFVETITHLSNFKVLIPKSTFHLWFLYYLVLITFVSVGFALVFKKLSRVSNRIVLIYRWAFQKTVLRVLVFSGLTCIVYFLMGTSSVATSKSFVPSFSTFIFYFFFYIVGWLFYKSKLLLSTMVKWDWPCTVLGLVLVLVYVLVSKSFNDEGIIVLKSVMVWLFISGITGLFVRYGSKHSSTMRYISDSSYWVYLIHLPITAIIPGLIVSWPVPATVKFLIVLTGTTAICFVTYHFMVRSTIIGKFLNGRKYSRKFSDIKKAEKLLQIKTQ